jgi:hypothetical protein
MDKSGERKNTFKNKDTFGAESIRNRRQKHTVEIRKQKREENLTKRRNMAIPDTSDTDEEPNTDYDDLDVSYTIK